MIIGEVKGFFIRFLKFFFRRFGLDIVREEIEFLLEMGVIYFLLIIIKGVVF